MVSGRVCAGSRQLAFTNPKMELHHAHRSASLTELQIQYVVETRFSYFGCSSYDLISHYMSPSLMYCAFSVSVAKQGNLHA